MKLIDEKEFNSPPSHVCELRARVTVGNSERPYYLLIDNKETLGNRVMDFLTSQHLVQCGDVKRIEYLCCPEKQKTKEGGTFL